MINPTEATDADSQAQGRGSVAKALADILTWSQNCPVWQRDALRRLCIKGRLDESDTSDLISLCKHRGKDANVFTVEHIPDPDAASATLNLRTIRGVKNVNALKPDEVLSFGKKDKGLTVVYGDNGAGKSGYARILKQVCRSRAPANQNGILPNIHAETAGQQQAVIEYTADGENRCAEWTADHTNDTALSIISIFDRNTANVHVESANDVAYTPMPMSVLEQLADVCKQASQCIKREIQELEHKTPAIIRRPQSRDDTAVGNLIAALGEQTKVQEVHDLATLSDTEKARLATLQDDIGTDPHNKARQVRALKDRLDAFSTKFETLQKAVDDEQIFHLMALNRTYQSARKAAEAAAGDLFTDEPLPDIGADVWRTLWEAARHYSEERAYPDKSFPFTGDDARCVLCQQELNDEATDRLNRFEDFVKDDTKRKENMAGEEYRAALDEIVRADVTIADIRTTVALIRDELNDDELAETASRAAVTLKWRIRAVRRNHRLGNRAALPTAETWPADAVAAIAANLSERIRVLLAENESEELRRMRTEFAELKDREWLATIQDDVIAEIDRLKRRAMLKETLKDTTTNRITTKSGEIAEQLVTNALCERFTDEIAKLDLRALKIELRKGQANYGVPRFKVSLIGKPDVPLGEVLSEGEHRCVALAAFLAELATTESRSAIVFDDPVSSLDHMHRKSVAYRLAEEGKSRQVIVFTHDIAFLFLLDQACREKGALIAFRSVSRNDEYAGLVLQDPPVRAQRLNKVIDGLQNQFDNEKRFYENGAHNQWERTVDGLQKRLRDTWERAVEEALSPVYRCLSDKVDTSGLAKVTVLTECDCNKMREAYRRCSPYLHSAPDALNRPVPTPEALQAEITTLRSWVEDIRQRQAEINRM